LCHHSPFQWVQPAGKKTAGPPSMTMVMLSGPTKEGKVWMVEIICDTRSEAIAMIREIQSYRGVATSSPTRPSGSRVGHGLSDSENRRTPLG